MRSSNLTSSGAALLVLLLVATTASGADDTAAWMKDREARFAAYQAAHPNPDAEIARIKAKTAALIAAYVQPPIPVKYADLRARSAALTPDQRAQAQHLFAAAFTLWQSGDFAAAQEGFAQGLEIDPANGMANYYMGDLLKRQNQGAQAAVSMDRAIVLAPGTTEALKAKAALHDLPSVDTDPALDQPPMIWRASDAPVELWDGVDAPEMIVVPAGDYTMGSPVTESGRQANEGPRHRVRIGYAFAVSKYPITVGEFARFVAETHHDAGLRNGRNWRRPGFDQTSTRPAVWMTWDDAQAYAAWLSRKTGHTFRLLSEAEYEYANRAGSTTTYGWGNDPDAACPYANGYDKDAATTYNSIPARSTCHDGFMFASPVGSFRPNPFALYDTTGNAWSWVSDCWNETYSGAPTDGSANTRADCGQRVLRGGSWRSDPTELRLALRVPSTVGFWGPDFGFRVARTL